VLANGENSATESNYAFLCIIRGHRAEADRHRQRANDLDPVGAANISSNAQFLVLAGRLTEARQEYEKLVSLNNGVNPKLLLNSVIAEQGYADVAIRNLLTLPQQLPSVQMYLAETKAMAGAPEEALRILVPLEQNYRDGRSFMYDFAAVYAAMDDEPNTVKWMERSMAAREGPAIYLRLDPVFAKMQNRPAFRALKKRMDLDW
jgi:predicted Zn-dependent protease